MRKHLIVILSLLLVAALLFTVSCGKETKKEKGEMTKEQYEAMSADDLIAEFVADPANETADEFVALVNTYRFVDIYEDEENAEMRFNDNNTTAAIEILRKDNGIPNTKTYIATLLDSEYPQVRAYAYTLMDSFTSVSDENMALAKEHLKTEDDPLALGNAAYSLRAELKDPEIAKFFFKIADSDIAYLRSKALEGIGSSFSKGVDGCVEKIIKMMDDENAVVAAKACSYSGKLEDDAVIEPLEKILKDASKADFHKDCIAALCDMWYNYPFHDVTNEKAYKVTMDYFRAKPRTEEVPAWGTVFELEGLNENKIDEWKEKAKYYSEDEIFEVMRDIILDPDAYWMNRTEAISVIAKHCPEKLASLKSDIEKLDDKNAIHIKNSFENKLSK